MRRLLPASVLGSTSFKCVRRATRRNGTEKVPNIVQNNFLGQSWDCAVSVITSQLK